MPQRTVSRFFSAKHAVFHGFIAAIFVALFITISTHMYVDYMQQQDQAASKAEWGEPQVCTVTPFGKPFMLQGSTVTNVNVQCAADTKHMQVTMLINDSDSPTRVWHSDSLGTYVAGDISHSKPLMNDVPYTEGDYEKLEFAALMAAFLVAATLIIIGIARADKHGG